MINRYCNNRIITVTTNVNFGSLQLGHDIVKISHDLVNIFLITKKTNVNLSAKLKMHNRSVSKRISHTKTS